MNAPDDFGDISSALSAITEPASERTAHWREALDRSRTEAAAPRRLAFRPWMGAALAACVVLVAAVAFLSPRISAAQRSSVAYDAPSADRPVTQGLGGFASDGQIARGYADSDTPTSGWVRYGSPDTDAAMFGFQEITPVTQGSSPEVNALMSNADRYSTLNGLGIERAVARDAKMSLRVENIRAAFARVTALVSDLDGEFVESSDMSGEVGDEGEGGLAHATVRLRIANSRLDSAMAKARELGEVVHEQTDARDVTDQLVDLDARLRNEQRVEAELLELLASRDDAPLADVLKVRDSLSSVRLRIEQLSGQRAAVSQRVALSTFTIWLTVEVPPVEVSTEEPHRGYLSTQIHEAWTSAGRTLADSLAWLVEVIVGGAIFWAIILVAGIVLVRYLRRRAAWA
ncbi:MAG: DUF4349 domain-containing protein [Phycisphaerales bacterium]|nr:DUF4349 domain-containing protein [Phycisphaerales bacterium]